MVSPIEALLNQWSDAFGNQVSDRTNVIDIASHYPYSPVRWRLFVDGARAFPEYGPVQQYSHEGDYHALRPNAGETVVFETTERPRYVVQYEIAATWAFKINQDLQSGDSIRIGLYDGMNGWYMEHSGGQSNTEADFVLERDGAEVYRETDVNIHRSVRTLARLKLITGWYDVTRQRWERSYPDRDQPTGQANDLIDIFTAPDSRGSKYGNLPLHYSVTASADTTDLVLEAGSCAQVNQGRTTPLTRDKKTFARGTIAVSNEWQPVAAYRVDPDRKIVNVQVEDMTIRETSTSADTFAVMQSFAPENVADANGDPLQDANFQTPNEQSGQSSVIEVNNNVAQVADSTGTLQETMSDPGGYQVEASGIYTGVGQNTTAAIGPGGIVKRQLSDRDYGVVLIRSASTGNMAYNLQTEQDW